jgi:hypothetical protein
MDYLNPKLNLICRHVLICQTNSFTASIVIVNSIIIHDFSAHNSSLSDNGPTYLLDASFFKMIMHEYKNIGIYKTSCI